MSAPTPFAGEPAGVGARIAAFSIDAVIVLALTAGTALLTGSFGFGLLIGGEAVLALWLLQARAGTSPGKAVLRLRVSRDDGPFSPGAGRAAVRGLFVAMGALVFGVGAWAVPASAAWDRTPARRSWADRAAQTLVIAAPARPRARWRGAASDAEQAHYAAPEPTVVARPWAPAPVAAAGSRGPAAPVGPPAPTVEPAAATGWAPAPPPAPEPVDTTSALLLIFDTGQRVQLAALRTAVLGRNPSAVEDGDELVIVTDPDASVSKNHLRLEDDRDGVWVTDLSSTNGTELVDENGRERAVPAGVRVAVDDGIRVRIGERLFTVSRLMGASS